MPKQIGIWGPRGTGKTCYIAMLIRNSGKFYSIVTNDAETKSYIRPLLLQIEMGELPKPTSKTFKSLRFTFAMEGISYPLVISDFGGELVEEHKDKTPEDIDEFTKNLVAILKEFIKNSSGIMLFFETEKPDEKPDSRIYILRKLEIDALIETLRAMVKEEGNIGRPLAIVLSKWDRRGEISSDFKTEQEKAKEYLKNSSSYSRIYNEILINFKNIDVFPISSFGKYMIKDGQTDVLPPSPHPLFLEEPIIWIIKKADEYWFENAKNYEKTILEDIEFIKEEEINIILSEILQERSLKKIERWIDGIGKILEYWDGILKKEFVFKENREYAERRIKELSEIIEVLNKKRDILRQRQKILKIFSYASIVLAIFLLLLGVEFGREIFEFSKTEQAFKSLPVTFENQSKADGLLDSYRKRFKIFDFVLNSTNKIKKRYDKWYEEFLSERNKEKQKIIEQIRKLEAEGRYNIAIRICEKFIEDYGEETEVIALKDRLMAEAMDILVSDLKNKIQKLKAEGEYEEIIKLCKEFEKKHGKNQKVKEWEIEAQGDLKRQIYENQWNRIKVDIQSIKGKEDREVVINRLSEFLDNNPDIPIHIKREAIVILGELKQKDKVDKIREEEYEAEVELDEIKEQYKKSKGSGFENIIKNVNYFIQKYKTKNEDYLNKYISDAKNFRKEVYIDWDRHLYENFYKNYKKSSLALDNLEEVYEYAKEYVNEENLDDVEDLRDLREGVKKRVNQWIKWYDKWKKGDHFKFEISKIEIDKKIKDSALWIGGKVDPYISDGKIQIGSKTNNFDSKPVPNTYIYKPNIDLTVEWKIGQNCKISMKLMDADPNGNDEIGELNLDIGGFVPKRLKDSGFEFKQGKKSVAIVEFNTSGWEPPFIGKYPQ